MAIRMTPELRARANFILGEALRQLDKLGLPGVLISFGEDEAGNPDMVVVSDAPEKDKAFQVLAVMVDHWRDGGRGIIETKTRRGAAN